jgi:hypothetical protein
MAAKAIFRGSIDISTGGTYDKVNATELRASGTLRIKSSNTGTVTVREADDTSNAVALEAGSVFPLVNVDLSKIELTASASDQGFEFVGDTDRGVP